MRWTFIYISQVGKYLILSFKSINYFCYSIVLINLCLEIMLAHCVVINLRSCHITDNNMYGSKNM